MAKYLIEDTTLTEIADAIRGTGITTGTILVGTFNNYIRNIKRHVMETIPQLPSGVTALDSGTVTPASDMTTQASLPHGLGVIPNFFLFFAEGQPLKAADFNYYITSEFGLRQSFSMGTTNHAGFRIYRYSNGTNFMQTVVNGNFATTTSFSIYASSTYSLKAGVTYRWVAGVLEGI